MSVLFLGSGPFGLPTLERLTQIEPSLRVGTVPDAPRGRKGKLTPTPIKARALELGLDVREMPTLRKPAGVQLLEETQAELVIVVDFRLLLTRSFLDATVRHCYNLHGSILPRWRGAAPISRAILAGDREFGVTLYRMVKELDAGPMVAVKRYAPTSEDFEGPEVETALANLAADLLAENFDSLKHGDVELTEQDHSAATFAPKLTKAEGWIEWSAPAEAIHRQVRALKPWPRTFSEWTIPEVKEPARLFIDACRIGTGARALAPGTVRELTPVGIDVACGSAGTETIILTQLQRAGKRSLPADDFLRGNPLTPGTQFVSSPPPHPSL